MCSEFRRTRRFKRTTAFQMKGYGTGLSEHCFACDWKSVVPIAVLAMAERSSQQSAYSAGASKFAHHLGLARAGTFAEQLILQDCVSHGSKPVPPRIESGAAAAFAAGDDNAGLVGGEELAGGALCETEG